MKSLLLVLLSAATASAALRAGAAKADITDYQAGPVNDPAFVKVLALDDGSTRSLLITVDAVSLGEIGYIDNGYLGRIRAAMERELGVPGRNVIVNASHCHHVVRKDADVLTIAAARQAWGHLTEVRAGAGRGREERIMENRRMRLKNGAETDVRRAYAMPRDEDVVEAGPTDPDIGLLRLDRLDGTPLAVIYNFAAHPIHGVPSGANTADYPAFASKAIEENLGPDVLAFFIQGCAGDINPAKYKDVHTPHDAEPLGNLLGLAALRALRGIRTEAVSSMDVRNVTLDLPRAADYAARISALRAKREQLMESLTGTSLNFKTFSALLVQYGLGGAYPSYYSHRYLHEKSAGREELKRMDADNRAEMERYLRNIETMEELTRLQTNLALLEKHQKESAGRKTLTVEVSGLRIGGFRLVTFPGELTVEIGLRLKKQLRGFAFVAGYTNGYIYYTPTAAQRRNAGYAQEDCDSLVAPEWEGIFERRALEVFRSLGE
ncbi:MAG: hypothetical protein JNK48_15560 [Bryobacterales bacterium]|nr:hypothetical protein [Bryobacterales bacterium]